MLIGAYRDNEVNAAHPLMRKLEAIRQAGAIVHEIILAPLTREDLGRLIADSLHCEPERVTPLAQLVHEKTAGNPFFAIQFISALAEEALLTFDHGDRRWSWDLGRIHAKGYTDNVVDLMVGKVEPPARRNPEGTTSSLPASETVPRSPRFPSFTGHRRRRSTRILWEALRLEFIVRLEGSYRFVHDRVQEAAYSLIPEELRAEAHLRIGRLLTARTPPERREEAIFEIVNQLNRGAALIISRDEREQLAELNLIAGKRAKASTAYTSALKYLIAGAALLASDSWAAPARAHLRPGIAPGRMRVPDWRAGGGGGALDDAFIPRRKYGRASYRRVLTHRFVHDSRSDRSRGCRSVLTTSDIWASNGRLIRQKRKRDANTSGSGPSSGAARSRSSLSCP